jgi:hypothetical protein
MSPPLPTRNIRHALASFVPNWLSNRKGLNVGYRVLYTIALMADVLVEMMLQGLRASRPGDGTPTALPVLGQGRGILQGYIESNGSFAQRLITWLTYWFNAGSGEVLAQMIGYFLSVGLATDPTHGAQVVRIVDRSGNWVTWQNGVTSTTVDKNWNWDGKLNPERSGWWSDIWIIICPITQFSAPVAPDPYVGYTSGNFADPAWLAAWGKGQAGIGHHMPRNIVNGILQIVSTWKGAHTFVQAIIWSCDPFLFVPGTLLSYPGNPDGTWGNWGKRDPATGHSIPARTRVSSGQIVRYWTPRGGG